MERDASLLPRNSETRKGKQEAIPVMSVMDVQRVGD